MAITPEACAPQNVERLIAALEKAEFLLQQERAFHEGTKNQVRCAIDPHYSTHPGDYRHVSWGDVLEFITKAAVEMRSPRVTEAELLRLRKNSDSDNDLLLKRQRQVNAYSGVVYALKSMATQSDSRVIRFSGDDLLLVINQLDGSPDL